MPHGTEPSRDRDRDGYRKVRDVTPRTPDGTPFVPPTIPPTPVTDGAGARQSHHGSAEDPPVDPWSTDMPWLHPLRRRPARSAPNHPPPAAMAYGFGSFFA